MMEITYIYHSGFLLEWANCYWLFDYFKGNIPPMDPVKKIFVFVSHKHKDHYNPVIFRLKEQYTDIQYLLSSDIRLTEKNYQKLGLTNDILDKVLSVKAGDEYYLLDPQGNSIVLRTLKSTDCGVAFLLHYQDKTVYHAGDLNLWLWEDESPQYNQSMTANFNKQMAVLKDMEIDMAFAPLDPRQEGYYYRGLESLLHTAKVKYMFPMHFGDNPSIIKQFKQQRAVNIADWTIMEISSKGQKWTLEI